MPRKSLWPWFAGMSGIVLSAAWLFIDAPAGFATGVSANQSSSTERSVAMDRTKFWKIIEHTKPLEADSDAQAAALRTELDRLAPVQIVAFEATFDQIMRESYSWDLWGATFVVHGGASDDGFEYFRVWLISKGRAVYETVLKDPDSLADLLAADSIGPLEFEQFAYIAREAWAAKTGHDAGQMPDAAAMMYPGVEPTGEPLQENEAHLAKRYPKLWKRFGHNPVQ